MSGALRYFDRGDLHAEADGEAVLRRHFEASVLATRSVQRLCSDTEFAEFLTIYHDPGSRSRRPHLLKTERFDETLVLFNQL